MALQQQALGAGERELVAALVRVLRKAGDDPARQLGDVDRLRRLGQLGAARARQRQHLGEHLAGAERVVLEAPQRRGALGFVEPAAQAARVQGQRGERCAQLVRQLVGQLALARECRLVALHQQVDGLDDVLELGLRVARHQRDVVLHVEGVHVLRELVERAQPAPHRQAEHQGDRGQQPDAGLGDLHRDVPGEVVALFLLDHHHDAARALAVMPAREGAPRRPRLAERQVGEAFLARERRQRPLAVVREHPAVAVPHHHAHRLLVVVALQLGPAGHARGGAVVLQHAFAVAEVEQQRGDARQVPVGQLVGLVQAGAEAHRDEAGPDHHQRAQRPGQQVAHQRGLHHGDGSAGTK